MARYCVHSGKSKVSCHKTKRLAKKVAKALRSAGRSKIRVRKAAKRSKR